jgi:rhodanese-related sulfurtransferase
MKTISVQELRKALETGVTADLIDVRTPAEYGTVHVTGAVLYPLDSLDCGKVLAARRGAPGTPVYVLCHSGSRAKRAAEMLEKAGCSDATVVEGGTAAWADAGYPVERGESRVLPLDRQLQIVMGCIVLTGVLLSRFVNPSWIWLSGFVGAGLIFAGTSGICPMRSLIAKMPWNQSGGKCGGSCGCA